MAEAEISIEITIDPSGMPGYYGVCVRCGGRTEWGESGPQYLCEECQKRYREAYERWVEAK